MNSKKTIEKTKLIKLISSFSTLEWKRFGRFVQSPFHNTNESIIKLYLVLKKAVPFDKLKNLEEERIYKKIYGTTPFDVVKFRNLTSDLFKLVEEFIIHIHLNKEKRKKDKILIDALSERNYELFKANSQQLIKEVEMQEYFLDEDDFLLLHQLNDELWHHIEKDKYTQQQGELFKTAQYLNEFHQTISIQLNAEFDGLTNYVIGEESTSSRTFQQFVQLYKEITELHRTKGTLQYFTLKTRIFNNWEKLKKKHKTNLLLHLINFSYTNELLVKEFGHQEPFSLYQIAIKEDLFIINGKMRDIEFVNVSIIGFELKETEWTINFIKTHQHYLSEDNQKHIVPLCNAYEGIFSNDYKRVIELLINVHPSNNLAYYLRIKLLLVRAFFQGLMQGESYDLLLKAEIEAIQKLIYRNKKITTIKLDAYKNFLKIFKKMLFLLLDKTKKFDSYEDLKHDLANTTPLVLKTWLHEKLEEIKMPLS